MRISVAICTYDRCRLLRRTLSSLAGVRVPDGVDWEVVVVDNRCTDATPDVVGDFAGELPVRRVEEHRPGLSHARNRAVEATRGDYVIWADDDVRVGREWVAAYARAFDRWPAAAFFGGPIHPLFVGDPPAWLLEGWEEVRGAYPVRDLSDEPFEITDRSELPYGANFAVARDVQARHVFDPRLGRSGTDLVGGEETEFLASLLARGRTGRWVPRAELEHVITPKQQTLSYVRSYYRDFGRLSELRRIRNGRDEDPLPELWGRPRWAWRSVLVEELRFWAARALREPREWLPPLKEASKAKGVLKGPPEDAEDRRAPGKRRW